MIDFFKITARWFDSPKSATRTFTQRLLSKPSRWKQFKQDVATKVDAVEGLFERVGEEIKLASLDSTIDEKKDRLLKDFRNWLSPGIDISRDLDSFNRKKLENSCAWIEKVRAIKRLLKPGNFRPGFLWITGKSGCGKSVVSAHLISVLQARYHIAYFFCKVQDGSKRTSAGILRSWAWQLLRYVGREKALQFSEPYKNGDFMTVDHALRIIHGLRDPLIPTWLLLDGLDECNEEDKERVLQACKILATDFMIAIISRRDQAIERGIEEVHGKTYVHVQITNKLVQPDIEAYSSQQVRELSTLNADLSMELQKEIAKTLSEGANGVFLWANLMSESLLKSRTIGLIKKRLRERPAGIDGIYRATLNIVREDQSWTQETWRNLFQWICFGYRALTLTELKRAVSIGLDESQYSLDNQVNDVRNMLLEKCGDFVEIDEENQTVQVNHASVKDFLLGQPFHPELRLDMSTAHANLARACLTYLSYKRDPLDIGCDASEEAAKQQYKLHLQIESNQFLIYSSKFWYQHLAEKGVLERHKTECITSFRRFAISEVLLLRWLQLCCCSDDYTLSEERKVPVVQVLNALDLSQRAPGNGFAKLLRSEEFPLLSKHLGLTESGQFTRWHRISGWRNTTLRYPALLSVAIYFDFADYVEKEIETMSGDIEKTRDRGLSPLMLAASGGAIETMQRLNKYNVLDPGKTINTPLYEALRGHDEHPRSDPGRYAVARKLLDDGYPVNATTAYGRRGMHGLLVESPEDTPDTALMAGKMIQKGFDITILDDTVRGIYSCLHIAIQKNMPRLMNTILVEARVNSGHEKIQRFLESTFPEEMKSVHNLLTTTGGNDSWESLIRAATDARVSALVDQGSPLHVAILTMPDMVPTLLTHEPDLTAVDMYGNQPLHLAARLDMLEVIEALIKAGADVQTCNSQNETPLDLAQTNPARVLLCPMPEWKRRLAGLLGMPPLNGLFTYLINFLPSSNIA